MRLAALRGALAAHGFPRVGVGDADACLALARRHETLVDGEGADGRGAVAAVALVVHEGGRHLDLREGVVHVSAGAGRRADDARLGQGRDATAQPVELAAVRIGTPERREEDTVALGARARQVGRVEDEAAARPAPAGDGEDPALGHWSGLREAAALRRWPETRCGPAPYSTSLLIPPACPGPARTVGGLPRMRACGTSGRGAHPRGGCRARASSARTRPRSAGPGACRGR